MTDSSKIYPIYGGQLIMPPKARPLTTGSYEEFPACNDSYLFPRCEYYARYTGTTYFSMHDERYYGTYHRATHNNARYYSPQILYTNEKLSYNPQTEENTHFRVTCVHTGTFLSPYCFSDYQKVICGKLTIQTPKGTVPLLYDKILKYKLSMCKIVINNVREQAMQRQIWNGLDYPCIIIRMPFANLESAHHRLLMSYYIGIVNVAAHKAGLLIEIVHRSSFGHNLPSVDDTGSSFRINIGLIPQAYAEILGSSLDVLYKAFMSITSEKKLYDEGNKQDKEEKSKLVNDKNSAMEIYFEAKKTKEKIAQARWSIDIPVWPLLNKIANSKGGKIVGELMRMKKYVDVLANFVLEELSTAVQPTALPIKKMLKLLTFNSTPRLVVSLQTDGFFGTRATAGRLVRPPYYSEISLDKTNKEFQELLNTILARLIGATRQPVLLSSIPISCLYSFLEKNHTDLITKYTVEDATDGPGSDSELDDGHDGGYFINNRRIYAKKIVVSTGMMAINLAIYAARYFLCLPHSKKGEVQVKLIKDGMYYETEACVKQLSDSDQSVALVNQRLKTNGDRILLYDINNYDTQASKVVEFEDIIENTTPKPKVVIFDCTSATSEGVKRMLSSAFQCERELALVILVSSGLKNEQGGFDNNPYGTLRIFTISKKYVSDVNPIINIHSKLLDVLDGNVVSDEATRTSRILPAQSHKIRKMYKILGFIPRNEDFVDSLTADYLAAIKAMNYKSKQATLNKIKGHWPHTGIGALNEPAEILNGYVDDLLKNIKVISNHFTIEYLKSVRKLEYNLKKRELKRFKDEHSSSFPHESIGGLNSVSNESLNGCIDRLIKYLKESLANGAGVRKPVIMSRQRASPLQLEEKSKPRFES